MMLLAWILLTPLSVQEAGERDFRLIIEGQDLYNYGRRARTHPTYIVRASSHRS